MSSFVLRLLYLAYRAYLSLFRPVIFGVRILLVQHQRVLLVRHTYRSGWHLPGGGIRRGETVEMAARREAREETGTELERITLLGIFPNFDDYPNGHQILFHCDHFRLVGTPDAEIAEVRFFSLDELPADMPSSHRRQVEAVLRVSRSS